MTAFHGFGALVLAASETLLILDIAAIPFPAFDVKLGEVAVTGDPYHLWVEFHHSNFIRFSVFVQQFKREKARNGEVPICPRHHAKLLKT